MKQLYFLSTLLFCAFASACPSAHADNITEMNVANVDADSPACHVRITVKAEQCKVDSCVLPVAKGASSEPVQLHFSCLPTSAPTGFENPPAFAKIRSISSKTSKGHLSLIDDINAAPADRPQELNFCLYGRQSNLCGQATTKKIRGKQAPAIDQMIALIKRIELLDATGK